LIVTLRVVLGRAYDPSNKYNAWGHTPYSEKGHLYHPVARDEEESGKAKPA